MPRGKKFHIKKALEQAMLLFWAKGYEATSTQDLVKGMGINRASLYDTFGNKHDLFIQTLRHYILTYQEKQLSNLKKNHSGRQAIILLFEQISSHALSRSGRNGCFLVNTALELAPHDQQAEKIVIQAFHRIELFFAKMIREAQEIGEISIEQDPETIASILMNMMIGLRVLARAQKNKTRIAAIMKGVKQIVQ